MSKIMHAFDMIEQMSKCNQDTFLEVYANQIFQAMELEEKELVELLIYLYERTHEESGLIKSMFVDLLVFTNRIYPEKLKGSIFHDVESAIKVNKKAN